MSDSGFPVEILDPSLPHQVHVISPLRRRYWVHLLLLAATVFTTMIVGARMQYNFSVGLPQFHSNADFFPLRWVLQNFSRLLLGLPFSATLLAILLAHEMGHFVWAQRNHVYATLPFFLPAPTLIGTMGAFIRIRSPIRTRAALFDIGIAGPIAGFIVAVPVLIAGLLQSHPASLAQHDSVLGFPVIFQLVQKLLHPQGTAAVDHLNLSPVAIAAWAGMFATSLNLLPGGQLDGGHIVYALFPRAHKQVSRLTVLTLVPMGIFLWLGWLIWAVLLLLSLMRHPSVPEYPPLDTKRHILGWLALAMLAVTMIPAPFTESGLWQMLH